CWHWLPRVVRYPAVAVEVLLMVLMTPLGATALVRVIEARLPPVHTCAAPEPTTIVVLSAGFDHRPAASDDYEALRLLSLRRLFAGVALWHKLPGARMVISGGGRWRIPEAVPMANLAELMGVPAAAIEIEDRSRSTWENARYVAALSPPVPKRIWLVSSALHLPRALGAFRAWGFEPCAWPSGLRDARLRFGPGIFIPQGWSVTTASIALHELLGEVEYAVLEWRHSRRAQTTQTP
ncbi:MAG: YdcF family protein, partial [Rhodanobacteraceae bacterium]